MKFFGAIEFSDIIRPACIRVAPFDVPEYENLVIAGWGSIEADSKQSKSKIKEIVFDATNLLKIFIFFRNKSIRSPAKSIRESGSNGEM